VKFDPEVNYNISKHYVQNNFLQVFTHEAMVIQFVRLKFSVSMSCSRIYSYFLLSSVHRPPVSAGWIMEVCVTTG
jgi:hypothetical protein